MFNIFKKEKQIEGEIGYYGLVDWWLATFTDEERTHIEEVFHPLGADPNSKPLTEGKIDYSSQNAAGLLHALAGWFNKPGDREIAGKIVQKAEEMAQKVLMFWIYILRFNKRLRFIIVIETLIQQL